MKINLHIERLVVDGLNIAPGQSHVLQSVVATELTRMLMEGGISSDLAKGIALPHISVDSIRLTSNNAEQVGQQIAQSVYGGIGHE